jgi:N-acetylglutamate synthase/N-acetylornithine aminotransferase
VAGNDWRVTVSLHDEAHAGRVLQSLHEHEAEEDVRHRLGQRVAVSAEGSRVFLYAGSENAAQEADRIARQVIAQHGFSADFALDRWHPVEEDWEDADVAMPQTDEERAAEHQRLEEEETRESLATGYARWEVRVELPSHREASELAERLQAEGRSVIRRWKFLVLGANDEDDARALARAIKQEAPAAASVHAEEIGPLLPFARFGPIAVW